MGENPELPENLPMPCQHLRELYEICNTHNLKLSSSDLIRIVCPACGVAEACPSVLFEDYEKQHPEECETPGESIEKALPGT